MSNRTQLGTFCVVLLLAGCADNHALEPQSVRHDTLRTVRDLISVESNLLGGIVTAMQVGPDGRTYLSDVQSNGVVSIGADGGEVRILGREGEGPGEFRIPGPLAVSASDIHVLDLGNRRVQRFSSEGTFVGSNRLAVPVSPTPQVGSRGEIAVPTRGHDDALVYVIDPDGGEPRGVGDPMAAPPSSPFLDASAAREQAARGEVPNALRNDVIPTWSEDGSIFLTFVAEPEVRRYSGTGQLRWATRFEEPEFDALLDDFFLRNREQSDPQRFFSLRYVSGASSAGGDLWLMLTPMEPGIHTVLVLDGHSGALRRRLILETDGLNLGLFGVDPVRGHLHAYAGGEARGVTFDFAPSSR
jgi:hypothetical protein